MLREILKKKLSEDIPEEMCIDFAPMSREQLADHFIAQFLMREQYKTEELCLKNYAYMLTSIVLSWRSQGITNNMTIN